MSSTKISTAAWIIALFSTWQICAGLTATISGETPLFDDDFNDINPVNSDYTCGSDDEPADSYSVSVMLASGGFAPSFTVPTADPRVFTITFFQEDHYEVTCTVAKGGETSTASMIVVVTSPPSVTISANSPVDFDPAVGSAVEIVTCGGGPPTQLTLTSGDASEVTISTANAPDYDVTYTAMGVYELTCTANSATASQSVTVQLGKCAVSRRNRVRCGPGFDQLHCEINRCCWDATEPLAERCFHPRDVCAFQPCLPEAGSCQNIGPEGSGQHLCPCQDDPLADCRIRQGSCAVRKRRRHPCGKSSGFGSPPWEVCRNRGCCYNNQTRRVPWCFHPKP